MQTTSHTFTSVDKTARKIRASQVSSYERLWHTLDIWEERRELVETRLKPPIVTEKGDEELLRDKERPPGRSEATRVKIPQKHEAHTTSRLWTSPKERYEISKQGTNKEVN
ncbi:hypothetical protein E1B28_001179 [Marasmius oreades]|uniref:Uncharacterized protein n=1 Tax=Marasmius oreades TaxID=181124 RepID=A0A9P7V2V4_9AGAR|nr:uncharacterized protein E1B28_001179 [Marasmius oreades]KAG7099321.1 hypothetical protein E1B28_001179 [Marasmius oreades]